MNKLSLPILYSAVNKFNFIFKSIIRYIPEPQQINLVFGRPLLKKYSRDNTTSPVKLKTERQKKHEGNNHKIIYYKIKETLRKKKTRKNKK